jgi:hypothetical protein
VHNLNVLLFNADQAQCITENGVPRAPRKKPEKQFPFPLTQPNLIKYLITAASQYRRYYYKTAVRWR